MHACAHIFALHIYKYVKEKCHASSSYRIATLCQQQGPTRPTRTNLSTVSGLPLQRLATLSPCSFEFIGACSNIHKKETSLAERSSTRFAPLVFLILQRRPPEPRRWIIIRIFKWWGGARREGTTGDRNLYICARVVIIKKSIVCTNKVLTDFVSKREFFVSMSGHYDSTSASYIVCHLVWQIDEINILKIQQ